MFCFVSLNFSLMLALLQLDNVRQFVVFFSLSLLQVLLVIFPAKVSMFLCISVVWKRAGSTGGVGVYACMWASSSTTMLSSALGKGSTVSLLPILGGWARRARWWCRVQHSQAWMQLMLTFACADCCGERKNLLFHMLVLVTTLPSTLYSPTLPSSAHHSPTPSSASSLSQMAPWTLFTLGDGPRCSVCPSASPFHPFHSLIPLLLS